MNWEAEMDKPLFVKKGGGFVTLRQAIEMRRLREGANWYAELRQKIIEAGFQIVVEAHQEGAAFAMTVRAASNKIPELRDEYARLLGEIFAPYTMGAFQKWHQKTGHGGDELHMHSSRGAEVIPAFPKRPGVYDVIFTPISDDPPHDDSGEISVAESVVDALLECVAVDLDGTLAKDSGWKGPEHIGEPVKPMLDLVKKLLDDGEDVVIFTARVHDGEKSTKEHIKQWLKDHDLPDLEITNEKRPDMEKFYDDKAVEVETNKGVAEALLVESPNIDTLEKNEVDLEPEERKQVMAAKAVWPFGKNGADSPAVHKAVVNGKPWYWSSTHRCYQVDPTVKAAIKSYHEVVEPSA